MGDRSAGASVQVDFKIDPILIPSAAIQKLEPYVYGSGGLGDVWKCSMSTPSGTRPVAVKSIRVHPLADSHLLHKWGRRIRRAAYVWIQLSHDHILPFEGIIDGFGLLPALVSLWMENGSLNDFLNREFSKLTDPRKLELIQQVAAGVSYLHDKDIVHGDLTGTNILLDGSGNIRIADFGLSVAVAESGNQTFGSVQTGNIRWIAPEFLEADFEDGGESSLPWKPTKAGDIYSFGCVMLQILSGKEPYGRLSTAMQVMNAIMKGHGPFRGVEIHMNKTHRDLSSQCLTKEPERRPSIVEITEIVGRAETYGLVNFKIKPPVILSTAIERLATSPHGSGGLGDVWKCSMSTPSGTRPVAVKSIRVNKSNDSELLRRAGKGIRREAYVWIQLSHEHIVPLEGIILDHDFGPLPALVSLWMENGTLDQYLKREFPQLSDRRKLDLIQQVAAGLSYLHGKDIVHGDLTPNNVLLDCSGNLRLTDFGLSMVVPESENVTFGSVVAGNTRWMAPEFVGYADDGEEPLKPTKAGDIYSFGCVMLQIFTGEEPFPRIKYTMQVIRAMWRGQKPFCEVEINMDESYKLLSSRCLSMEPETRPSVLGITTILDPVKTFAVTSSPLPTRILGALACPDTDASNSTHPHSEHMANHT